MHLFLLDDGVPLPAITGNGFQFNLRPFFWHKCITNRTAAIQFVPTNADMSIKKARIARQPHGAEGDAVTVCLVLSE